MENRKFPLSLYHNHCRQVFPKGLRYLTHSVSYLPRKRERSKLSNQRVWYKLSVNSE